MAKPRPKGGSEDLPYHELIRMVQKECNYPILWEKPVSLITGLFSSPESDEKNPAVLDTTSDELTCRADLKRQMKKWQTGANVDLNYTQIKKMFTDIETSVRLKLQFEDPKDFMRSKLREKIQEGEALQDSTKQGMTRLLKTVKILEMLVDFARDYRQEFSELIKSKNYESLEDLIVDMLSTEWGKKFHNYLERANVVL